MQRGTCVGNSSEAQEGLVCIWRYCNVCKHQLKVDRWDVSPVRPNRRTAQNQLEVIKVRCSPPRLGESEPD
jgi:hypothetical protein